MLFIAKDRKNAFKEREKGRQEQSSRGEEGKATMVCFGISSGISNLKKDKRTKKPKGEEKESRKERQKGRKTDTEHFNRIPSDSE